MGQLEIEQRRRTRKNELRQVILKTVQTAGIIGVGILAPNVLGAMAKLGMIPSSRQGDVVKRSSARLVRMGLLAWSDGRLRLTKKGEQVLRMLELKHYKVARPRRWDHKWRVLVFDIPERRKHIRERVREALSRIGFVRLQDSVWIYPYDCEDFITLLKADFHIGDDMRYIIADSIERDAVLRRNFKLSSAA